MKTLHLQRRGIAAFTLLEIMLVVMIIALLAGSAIYLMKDNLGVAQDVKVDGDIQLLETSLLSYETFNGNPPSTAQGLDALVNRPAGEPQPRKWKRLMSEVPVDPWGNAYVYEYPAKRSGKTYDIYSKGKDRTAGTEDDLGNWKQ
jgi:general secretion pathway protein G